MGTTFVINYLLVEVDGWDAFLGQTEGSSTSSVLEREKNGEQDAFMPLTPMGAYSSWVEQLHGSLVNSSGSDPVVDPHPHASLVYKGFFDSSDGWLPALTTFSAEFSYSVASVATETTRRTE